jgi:hypothetical protein
MTIDREEAKTLRELGIDGALARDIELAMRVTGRRFSTFVAPSGERYRLVLESDRDDIPEAA